MDIKKTIFAVTASMFVSAAAAAGTSFILEKRADSAGMPVIEVISADEAAEYSESETAFLRPENVEISETLSETTEAYVLREHSIDINTADREELMKLKGIGEKTADKIIEYRNNSPFEDIRDIMNVSGIGEKKFADMEPYIYVANGGEENEP
ncbi:MAG: ComEA family DNA-binding protein [Huintestinicola sp.]